MTTPETVSHPGVLYHLSNEAQDLQIRTVVAADGSVTSLRIQEGDGEPCAFSADAVTALAGDGVRVSVVLDDGGASLVMTTFELILPLVFLGDDVSEEGPFGVRAAGLRVKHFITTTGHQPAGPLEEFEAIGLFARAIAHHPQG